MDQETKKVISKDFQDVLLDTSTVVVSSVFDQENKIVGGENASPKVLDGSHGHCSDQLIPT